MNKILCTVLLLASSNALADEGTAERCHEFDVDSVRLACYDLDTGYKSASGTSENLESTTTDPDAPEATPTGTQWRYSEDASALDNRKDIWLSVRSENTEPNSIGSPIRATLWVRCMENKTNVLIGFDSYTTDNQNVRFKLDDGAIQRQWMEVMRGGDGIGIWTGRRAIPFVRGMFGANRMVIAYDTYSGPVEFTFNISGLRNRITPLADECGWTP